MKTAFQLPLNLGVSLQKSGTAKVYLEDGTDGIGRELFTRVAHMGFIVGEIYGVCDEIKFINTLGEHHHYLPEEVELNSS